MGTVIGVYGILGSGKSTVSILIETNFRFFRMDADKVGHECLEQPSCKKKLIQRFGASLLQKNGLISRERISSMVFNNPTFKMQLECILWPMMTRKMMKLIHQNKNVVLDAALLFTAKWNTLCDYTVYVETEESKRIRFLESRSYSLEQMNQILALQNDIGNQKGRADYLIQNTGSIEDLTKRVINIMADIESRETIISWESCNKKETREAMGNKSNQSKERMLP